jgi:hypothetical protein
MFKLEGFWKLPRTISRFPSLWCAPRVPGDGVRRQNRVERELERR